MNNEQRLEVFFYKTESGKEIVREWLKSLSSEDRKLIGQDIKTVQFGYPLGMPLVRKLERGLWEVRSTLDNRIARVIFTVDNNIMVLLHGFIKKSQKTPKSELDLAKQRMKQLKENL